MNAEGRAAFSSIKVQIGNHTNQARNWQGAVYATVFKADRDLNRESPITQMKIIKRHEDLNVDVLKS